MDKKCETCEYFIIDEMDVLSNSRAVRCWCMYTVIRYETTKDGKCAKWTPKEHNLREGD